ncbi:hypothetical protein [Proteiniphilum sp.]|uniref:hypothetical protein n=1 Tax=Proteiniphilum sp. TaxID=1926877 RepID=UPI002B1F4442|nr:hypothetical protein [Proteiniphilum sp.]
MQCTSNEKSLNKKLEKMAASYNESAPLMFNQYIRFDKAVVASENVFQYHYTVLNTANPDSLLEGVFISLKEEIVKKHSLEADLRIFKENKIPLEYIYRNEKGVIIRSLKITPEDYQ